MKIVITDGFAVNPGDLTWDWLKKYGEVTVYDKISDDEAPDAIGDADIVFTNRVKIGAKARKPLGLLQRVSQLLERLFHIC
jgi:glycerate dehydrogenase